MFLILLRQDLGGLATIISRCNLELAGAYSNDRELSGRQWNKCRRVRYGRIAMLYITSAILSTLVIVSPPFLCIAATLHGSLCPR